MKKIILFAFAGIFSASIHAQQGNGPVLQFDNTHHNFGQIKEDDGPVSHSFHFTNTGNKKLILNHVQPACGCTVADWTKDSIAPGKEGYVKATFDPRNRPGTFSKSVTVTSNANPNVSLLTFSGEVLPHVKTLEDSFPEVSGNLRFESKTVNFGYLLNNNKDTTQMVSMYNSSNTPVVVKGIKNTDAEYITLKNLPFTVAPKHSAKLPIHYHATQKKDYGIIFDQVKLITNDAKDSTKTISVVADIHQYVRKPVTDAEKAKAPVAYFPATENNFGDVKQGDAVSTNFKIVNKGKSELYIYNVKTTCGCTVSKPEKNKLAPGEETNIKVTFNSAGKKGKEQKGITVYTNDPFNPEAGLKIYANVVVPEEGK